MVRDKNWSLGTAGSTLVALNAGFYFIKQHNLPLSSEAAQRMLPRVSICYKNVEATGQILILLTFLYSGCSKEKS